MKRGKNKYLFNSGNRSAESLFSKAASPFTAVETWAFRCCSALAAALQMVPSVVPTPPYPALAPSLPKNLMHGFSVAIKSSEQPSTERRQLMLHFCNRILKSCIFFFPSWIDNVSLPWFIIFKHADLHTFPVILFSMLTKCADMKFHVTTLLCKSEVWGW